MRKDNIQKQDGLKLKDKKSRLNKVVYSKKYISSNHGKIGQRENKFRKKRTIIERRGIKNGLRQKGEK